MNDRKSIFVNCLRAETTVYSHLFSVHVSFKKMYKISFWINKIGFWNVLKWSLLHKNTYNIYMGYTYTKKITRCLSKIQIQPGILNFYLLNLATLNKSHFETLSLPDTSRLSLYWNLKFKIFRKFEFYKNFVLLVFHSSLKIIFKIQVYVDMSFNNYTEFHVLRWAQWCSG